MPCHFEDHASIKVPIKVDKVVDPRGFTTQKMRMIDPHRLLHWLFADVGIDLPPSEVKAFWEKEKANGAQWATCSPASHEHVPVALYGDACALVNNIDSMVGIFLSLPLFRPYSTRCRQFCIFAIEVSRLDKERTLRRVMHRVMWSMNLAFDRVDEFGNRLARRFCVTEFKGDWQWYKVYTFKFCSAWNSVLNPCFRCNAKARATRAAEDPGVVYYNTQENTPWHELSCCEFLARQLPEENPCRLNASLPAY